MREEIVAVGKVDIQDTKNGGVMVKKLKEKVEEMMNSEEFDEETSRMVGRYVVIRISTKHINLWMRQLEMKRKEICELAGLMGFEDIKKEVETEKSLECWARRCTRHFTKKTKRMLYAEIDNVVWNDEGETAKWCEKNKVYDEITEKEIDEIWQREGPDDDEPIRLNGKYVWETAKRVCQYINTHPDIIHITSFSEYRAVMRKVTKVIKEAHNVEKKRRQTAKKKRGDETKAIMQRAEALIGAVKE